MTPFRISRGRATTAALLATVAGVLAAAPASQAASTLALQDGNDWLGFYTKDSSGDSVLRASSQEVTASATRDPKTGKWSAKGTSTVWDRSTDGSCAHLTLTVYAKNGTILWVGPEVYTECAGVQKRFSFSTGALVDEPRTIYRRLYTSGGPFAYSQAFFYDPS